MALEWLKAILKDTYSEDVDKQISAEIGKAFVSKTDFDTKNTACKEFEKQIAERDKQLEELKKVDSAGLQAEITKLQSENKTAKDTYEKQLNDMKFGHALDSALTGAKAKNSKAVKALLESDKLKLNEDGSIIGLDEQIKKLKADADYLFESEDGVPQIIGGTPGAVFGSQTDVALRAAAGLPPIEQKK